MQPVMAHRGSGSTATVTMTVASGHGGEIGQAVAQAGTQVRNPDQIADAPLFERRVEPADASKAAAGLGIVGISRTELRPRWRVEVRLPCQAMAPRKPGHRTRAPLPTHLAPFFLASPVLLSKHVFTPITELGPIARLLSAFERTIAIAGASNGGALGSQRADLRGMRGSAQFFRRVQSCRHAWQQASQFVRAATDAIIQKLRNKIERRSL